MNLRLMPLYLLSAVSLMTAPVMAAPSGWQLYTDVGGSYQINYPPEWQAMSRGNALVIASPGSVEERGVFGITPRAEGTTIEDSVKKEFGDPDHSADLKKVASRIAGRMATKVWGSKKGDPSIRIVEYYVQDGHQQFYILFQAPHAAMAQYSPVFNTMIGSMQFLK